MSNVPVSNSNEYAQEIKSWLLGRVEKRRQTHSIDSADRPELFHRVAMWWMFEGKQYGMLQGTLAASWSQVDHQVRRLLTTYNPVWRSVAAPEGETDWVATAFASATASRRVFVSRASHAGLGDLERQALLGWLEWITRCWLDYTAELGPPEGSSAELPWDTNCRDLSWFEPAQLKRWAHAAKRSRWPLLRTVVAESLRCVLEPQDIDQLPLPSDPPTLFELVCMVRILRFFDAEPSFIRWIDAARGNKVRLPGLTYRTQHTLSRDHVLSTYEFDHGLRDAFASAGIRAPARVDGWLTFDEPRAGFHGILVEAKSGTQGPEAAVYQLKAYRAALQQQLMARLVVWGVTESEFESPATTPHRFSPSADAQDHWVFSSASEIPLVLASAGLTP